MTQVKRVFKVDGKPFFPIGAQANNSSGFNEKEAETAFKAIKTLGGNTLEMPVYWGQVEPKEGKFDFTPVDALLILAKRYGLKLILLWFGTWKNANMDYTPAWVKTNPERFKRVTTPNCRDLWSLSPHCKANLEADKKAFTAFCKYLKAKDSVARIVIGLQVENEPGMIGSDRDYGVEAEEIFDNPVPAAIVNAMKKQGSGTVYEQWQKTGGKKAGNWPEMFGWSAGEFMSAWSIASYIDEIAAAGKAVYDIPMYTNAWKMEIRRVESRWATAGETYPSGGAVSKVLDIYKWVTPHLDMIAPDIKSFNPRSYEAMCAVYARPDNPFFLPETPSAISTFRAIADYNLIGDFFFGAEDILAPDGTIRPESQPEVDTIRMIKAAIPLILKYQGTGRLYAIGEEEDIEAQLLDMEGYMGSVVFIENTTLPNTPKDWRHKSSGNPQFKTSVNRARGMVIQASKNEFYLVGDGYRLFFRPKLPPEQMLDATFVSDYWQIKLIHQISVDEGHFNEKDEFIVDRQRSGDALCGGVWVAPDVGVVRVIMCD
jgi:hypothetical protein